MIAARMPAPDATEIRTSKGRLAGWAEEIPTAGGVSTTHVWAICRDCGGRLMVSKKRAANELAEHRQTKWGTAKNSCHAPIDDWLLDRAAKLAKEVGFKWRQFIVERDRGLDKDDLPRGPSHAEEGYAICEPFRRAFGEAWPRRFWCATQDQIDADFVRAIAAISPGGTLESA